jgi:predicted outer membrane repeat protein
MYTFADGIGTAATFSSPNGIVIDKQDANLYISDSYNNRIRQLQLSTGSVTTLAGNGAAPNSFDGVGTSAYISNPSSVDIDPTGTYLVVNDGQSRLRRITLSNKVVTTLSQTGMFESNPSSFFSISSSGAMRFDPTGTYLYLSQYSSLTQLNLNTGSTRSLNTYVTVGQSSYYFYSVSGLALDSTGADLYFCESMYNMIGKSTLNNPCSSGVYCPAGTTAAIACPPAALCPALSETFLPLYPTASQSVINTQAFIDRSYTYAVDASTIITNPAWMKNNGTLSFSMTTSFPTMYYSSSWLTISFSGQSRILSLTTSGALTPASASTENTAPITFSISAINSYGYTASFNVVLVVMAPQIPDSTSVFGCIALPARVYTHPLIANGSLAVSSLSQLYCNITARLRGADLPFVAVSSFTLMTSPANTGIFTFANTGDSTYYFNQGIQNQFQFIYSPPSSGANVQIVLFANGSAAQSTQVYAVSIPDAASILTCNPSYVLLMVSNTTEARTSTCTLQARQSTGADTSQPAFSFWPFHVDRAQTDELFGSPYCVEDGLCVVPDGDGANTTIFTDVNPPFSNVFTFNATFPIYEGYIRVVAASSIVTSVQVSSKIADDTSTISCGFRSIQANGSALLTVFPDSTIVSGSSVIVCQLQARYQGTPLLGVALSQASIFATSPGKVSISPLSDGSAWQIKPFSNVSLPLNISIALRLITLNQYAPQNYSMTIMSYGDSSTLFNCYGDNDLKVAMISSTVICQVVPRFRNQSVLVTMTSLSMQLQSLSSTSVLLDNLNSNSSLFQRFVNGTATIWRNVLKGTADLLTREFLFFFTSSSISETLKVTLTDPSGVALNSTTLLLLTTVDSSSSLSCPTSVNSATGFTCTASAASGGSSVSTRYLSFRMTVNDGYASNKCTGAQALPWAADGMQFSSAVSNLIQNGVMYINLCYTDFINNLTSSAFRLATTSSVIVTRTGSSIPNATLSCRRWTISAGAKITCYWYGFSMVSGFKNPLYADVTSLALTATKQISSSTRNVAVTMSLTATSIPPLDAVPRIPIQIYVSGPFATVNIADRQHAISSTLVSVAAGKLLSWRPMPLNPTGSLDQTAYSLLARKTSFADFSAMPASVQMQSSMSVQETSAGSTVGSERFISFSCSSQVCMAVCETGFLYSWGTNNAYQALGRSSVSTFDSRGLITADQNGWQHLVPSGSDLYKNPAIIQAVVNPIDHSTAALTDDGNVLLIGSQLAAAGSLFVVPIDVFGASVVQLTAGVSGLWSHSAYWLAATASPSRLFAFRYWSPTSQLVSSEVLISGATPSTTVVSAVFVSSTRVDIHGTPACWYEVVVLVYSDGSLFVGGSGLPLSTIFGSAANSEMIMSVSASDRFMEAIGLPRQTVVTKVDGYYNAAPNSVASGRVYLLTSSGRIYIMSLGSLATSSSVFVPIETVFMQSSLATVKFSDLSGDSSLVASDKAGNVYSQKYGQFSMLSTGFSGTSVSALHARGTVALACVVPSTAVLSPPSSTAQRSVEVDLLSSTMALRSGLSSSIIASAVASITLPGTVLQLSAGTYTETMMSSSVDSITIQSTGSSGSVIIECCGVPSCMQFTGDQITLIGLTIRCDQSPSCAQTQPYVVPAGKQHSFVNVTFQGCSVSSGTEVGGAVSVFGSLDVQDSVFDSNSASTNGGAIACTTQAGSLSVSNTQFVGNSAAQSGGAVFVQQCTSTFQNVVFSRNSAAQGGAIFVQQATTSLSSTAFMQNSASLNGGASMFRDSTASLVQSNWTNNTASQSGGGVYLDSTVASIVDCAFSTNVASPGSTSCASCSGGALYCQGQRVLTVNTSSFQSNSIGGTVGVGGAIFLSSCLSTVALSSLKWNTAGTGGALAISSQAILVLDSNQFVSNTAFQSAGALYAISSRVSCASSLFSQNSASINGGALYISTLATFDVTYGNSFSGNSAGQGGGAVYWDGVVEPGLQGSVFSLNSAQYGADRATQARLLRWTRLATGLKVSSRQLLFDTPFAFELKMYDFYQQLLVSDSTSSLTLQTVAPSSLPSNIASIAVAGSTMPVAVPAAGSIVGTISCKLSNGTCIFGSSSGNAFAVEVTPTFALPLRASVLLSSGTLLTSPFVLVPTRACVPGEFIDVDQCSACPIGTFSNTMQASTCQICVDGYYNDQTNQTSCVQCPDGHQCTDRKSKTVCSSQAYRVAATASSGTCILCPPNSASDSSRLFCRCDVGYYLMTDSTSTRADKLVCRACPAGADCSLPGTTVRTVLPKRGYWPEIQNSNTTFIPCINSGCSGGVTKCEPHYEGNLCTSCSRGYSRDSAYECTVCPSSASTFWQVLGVIAVVCLLCACIIFFTLSNTQFNIKREARREKARQEALAERKKHRDAKLLALSKKRAQHTVEEKQKVADADEGHALPAVLKPVLDETDPEIMEIIAEYEQETQQFLDQEEANQSVYPTFSILVKIFTSFLQFNSLATAFNFKWPDAVMWIMNLQKEMAEIAANIISVDCAAYQTGSTFSLFYMKKIVIAFLPPIVVIIPLVLIVMWAIILKLFGREISFHSMRVTLVTSVIVVLFFLLPMITHQAFGMLSCIKLGIDSSDYFIVDNMDERCWGSQHFFYMMVVCLPMVVMYVFGIPFFSFRLLWKNRFELHTADVKQYFFFLYTGYELEYWFWEYTIVTRKILLVAISVFFQTNAQLQACMFYFYSIQTFRSFLIILFVSRFGVVVGRDLFFTAHSLCAVLA